MANEIIREYAKASDVKLWQIAEAMGITDQWLSRKLRNELTETETDRIMGLIDEVRNTKAQRGLRKPPLKRCNWSEGWTCIKELCVRRNCLVEMISMLNITVRFGHFQLLQCILQGERPLWRGLDISNTRENG